MRVAAPYFSSLPVIHSQLVLDFCVKNKCHCPDKPRDIICAVTVERDASTVATQGYTGNANLRERPWEIQASGVLLTLNVQVRTIQALMRCLVVPGAAPAAPSKTIKANVTKAMSPRMTLRTACVVTSVPSKNTHDIATRKASMLCRSWSG